MYNGIDPRERSSEVARRDVVDPDELEAGSLHRPDECLVLRSTRSSTGGIGVVWRAWIGLMDSPSHAVSPFEELGSNVCSDEASYASPPVDVGL